MSNYTVTTDFEAKDSLQSGDPAKIIRGSEFTTEFTNIATAIATKSDLASPQFTGVVTAPALTVTGTLTAGLIDGGNY
jgi:hypothetical protein